MFQQLFSNNYKQTNIALDAILAKLETIYPYDTPKTTKDIRSTNPSKAIPIMDKPQEQRDCARNNIAARILRLSSTNAYADSSINNIVWIIIVRYKELD